MSPLGDAPADAPVLASLLRLREALAAFDAVVAQRGEDAPRDAAVTACEPPDPDGPTSPARAD